MADQKITQLNENTSPATSDLLVIVDDPSGSPETQKITIQNLLDVVNALTAITSGLATTDELLYVDDPSGTPTAKKITLDNLFGNVPGDLVVDGGFVNLGSGDELTISGGVVTAVKSYHSIDTESDAASDNLDTINGGSIGDVLICRANNSTRTVVFKDGTGNLMLAGDFSADNVRDSITLLYDSNAAGWIEIARSNNA